MKKLLYRILRNDMVVKMRDAGFSWNKINQVLMATGSDKIVKRLEETPKGIKVCFEPVDQKEYEISNKMAHALEHKRNNHLKYKK